MSPTASSPTAARAPAPRCLLTLALPQALEDSLLDILQALPEAAGPCELLHGQALGAGIELLSAMEQVQGRARRSQVQVLLPDEAAVKAFVEALRQRLPHPDIVWWALPVPLHGSLA